MEDLLVNQCRKGNINRKGARRSGKGGGLDKQKCAWIYYPSKSRQVGSVGKNRKTNITTRTQEDSVGLICARSSDL